MHFHIFFLRMVSAAFFKVVPNSSGGILTISTNVETENNYKYFLRFQFMSLWVIFQKISIFYVLRLTSIPTTMLVRTK